MAVYKEDFADAISQRIFQRREAFYRTGNYDHIIELICEDQKEYIEKINSHCSEILDKIKKFKGKFVIYGMGKHARIVKDFLFEEKQDKKLLGFCNSDKSLCSNKVKLEGLPCIWVNDLKSCEDILILIPSGTYAFEMKRYLQLVGMQERFIMIPFTVFNNGNMTVRSDLGDILLNRNNHLIVYGDDWSGFLFRQLLQRAGKHADFVISDDSKLTNDLSLFREREDYYLIVCSRKRRDELLRNKVPVEKIIQIANIDDLQYFDAEIVPKHMTGKRCGAFVDGGSMDLCTTEAFFDWCGGETDHIFAFEPEEKCINICEQKLREDIHLSNAVSLFKKGLWSKETELSFLVAENMGSSRFEENSRDIKVGVTSIDECVKNVPVAFIKMDIEGSELEALKGAKNTIIRNKPILAVSLYHKPQDIVELPGYIKELVPEYKLYIRNYHQDATECVLYAVTSEDEGEKVVPDK